MDIPSPSTVLRHPSGLYFVFAFFTVNLYTISRKCFSNSRISSSENTVSSFRNFWQTLIFFSVISGSRDTFLAPKYRDKIDNNFQKLFDVDLKVILPKLREKSQLFNFTFQSRRLLRAERLISLL